MYPYNYPVYGGYPGYPQYSYDDSYLRAHPPPSPRGSPRRQSVHFEDDYWNPRGGAPQWAAVTPAFIPSPNGMVPVMLPSPHGSPRLGPATMPSPWARPYSLPVDPFYHPGIFATGPHSYMPHHTYNAQVHPLLNGEITRQDLVLDLSISKLTPLTPSPHSSSSLIPVHSAYLDEPATYPPVSKIKLHIPDSTGAGWQWGDIKIQQSRTITIKDVLKALHMAMHAPITQVEYARVSNTLEIDRAYTKRCRAAFGSVGDLEARQGVRRVDFLRDECMFGGLVRKKDGDVEHLKVIFKRR